MWQGLAGHSSLSCEAPAKPAVSKEPCKKTGSGRSSHPPPPSAEMVLNNQLPTSQRGGEPTQATPWATAKKQLIAPRSSLQVQKTKKKEVIPPFPLGVARAPHWGP